MTANLIDPLSPCYSDCDSVSGLLEKDNNIKNNNNNNSKISKRDILSQVVQTFRFSKTRQYTTLGSCPNLAHITSETLVLKDNGKYDKFKDKMLNVNTPYGTVQIFKTGNPLGPSLVTLHDLGLDGFSNFSGFFSQPECADCKNIEPCPGIVSKFCILNLSLPGQEGGATSLGQHFTYPTQDQLAKMVEMVLSQVGVGHCVMMGVGMGGYLALNLGVNSPGLVDGLILVNTSCSSSGWLEWAFHKVNIHSLRRAQTVSDSVLEFLIWHHLGTSTRERGLSLMYRQYFAREVNPVNLSLLLQSYANRREISLHRNSLKMPVLNIVGDSSPHVEATLTMNTKVDPAKTTWMKISNTAMVLEEQPDKVAEALGLFLQGLGYTIKIGRSRSDTARPTKLDIKGYDTPLVKLKVANEGKY